MEGHAFFNFIKKYEKGYGSHKFQYQSLDGAVGISRVKKIPLLLYLHVDNVEFSHDFLAIIENEHDIFEKFTLLLWDIEETEVNKHLIESCKEHLKFNIICDFISNQTSALFVINVEEEFIKLNQMYVEISDNNFISNLIMNSSNDDNLIAKCSLAVKYRRKRRAIALDVDPNAISGIGKKKLKSVSRVPIEDVPQNFKNQFKLSFKNCPVKFEESIVAAKMRALKDEVPLILYYYKREDTFYDMFYSLMGNDNINDLFNNFCIYVYDQNNENENNRFLSQNGDLNHRNQLESVFIEGRSCVIIYSTISGNISLSKVLKDIENEDNILEQLYSIYLDHDDLKEKNNKIIEDISVATAINDIDCSLFECNTLQKSIEVSLSREQLYKRKIFVLYYHNRDDIFWSCFEKFLNTLDAETKYNIENLFYLLPWDVTEPRYHAALKSSIEKQFGYQEMKDCIDHCKGSLFFFVSSNDKHHLFNRLHGEVDMETFQTIFNELAVSFAISNNITALDEYKACNKSGAHFAFNKCIKPMDTIIRDYCLCFPVKSRKMLVVHCYDKTEKVSMELVKALKFNSKLKDALKQCVFVSWDITDSNVNKNLKLAVHRYFGLKIMENFIQDKKPALYMFMPICESLTLASCILGSTSISKICNTLENVGKHFIKEKDIEAQLPEKRKDNFGPTYLQQMMYDQLGNRDYDCFQLDKDEGKHLKEKIAFAYYGQPEEEKDGKGLYNEKQQQKVDEVYEKIVNKGKEFSEFPDDIVFTCIYNCLVPLPQTKLKKLKKDGSYDPNLDFSTLPVFVIRKCIDSPKHSACRIFIDSDLREYNTWDDYLNDNKHPEGIFIAPLDGKYQGDAMGNVRVQYLLSPACGMGIAILKGFDVGTAVVGVGAGVVGATALIPAITVAPVILIGATVAGVGVGIYSLVRSTVHLVDRHLHGESLSVANSEARGAYFNIIAGTLGFTGAGANFALVYFARSGADIGLIARGAINGLTAANIVGSGAAVANSTYEVINDWVVDKKRPSTLTIIQLSSSILFFGHAVYNARAAGTIIREAQAQTINEFNSSLRSNRHRRTFDKLAKETIRVSGDVQKGQAEVISYIKNLNNQDEVFAVLTKANKQMNKNGVRFAINNGEVNFNGMKININEFGSLTKMQQNEYLLNMPEMAKPSAANVKNIQFNIKKVFTGLTSNPQMLNIAEVAIKSGSISVQVIADTINFFSTFVQNKILILVRKTIEYIGLDFDLNKSFIELVPKHDRFLCVLRSVIDYFRQNTNKNNRNEKIDIIKLIEIGILIACKSPEGIIKELIKHFNKRLAQMIYDKFADISNNSLAITNRKKVKCEICEGTYFS